jgi:hypothetical protein
MNLSKHLRRRSREICRANGCKRGEHHCDSYAYITAELNLLDICLPDDFQGHGEPHAAIALPWIGGMRELKREVEEQCHDQT